MGTGAGAARQMFSGQKYAFQQTSVSIAEMQFLLGVHAAIDPLSEPSPEQLVIPDKDSMFWDLLSLWMAYAWPDHTDLYLKCVNDAALSYYNKVDSQPPSASLDPRYATHRPADLVADTLARFQGMIRERTGISMSDPTEVIRGLAREVGRLTVEMVKDGLVLDPIVFDVSFGSLMIAVATLSLARGKYFSLTQKGKYARHELVLGLIKYRHETGRLDPSQSASQISVEWDIPSDVLERLSRAVQTTAKTRATLLNPRPRQDSKEDETKNNQSTLDEVFPKQNEYSGGGSDDGPPVADDEK